MMELHQDATQLCHILIELLQPLPSCRGVFVYHISFIQYIKTSMLHVHVGQGLDHLVMAKSFINALTPFKRISCDSQ